MFTFCPQHPPYQLLPKLCFSSTFGFPHSQNKRVNINKDELKSTSKAIETVHNLCCNENKGATELVAELGTLYQCIRWELLCVCLAQNKMSTIIKTLFKSGNATSQTNMILIQSKNHFCYLSIFNSSLLTDPSELIFVFRFPVVAMGVLKWVDWTVSEPRYFQLQTDHTPVHLALLDEVKISNQIEVWLSFLKTEVQF